MAVAIKVSHSYGLGIGAAGVARQSLECAVAVAQQDLDRAANLRQVELAVAVKVPHRQGMSSKVQCIGTGCLEAAVALAYEQTHATTLVVFLIRHGEIEMTIPVEITNRYRGGTETDAVALRRS